MQVQPLGWEDLLEKKMASHSNILSEKFHGQRSLMGYNPCGRKESDTTELLGAQYSTSHQGPRPESSLGNFWTSKTKRNSLKCLERKNKSIRVTSIRHQNYIEFLHKDSRNKRSMDHYLQKIGIFFCLSKSTMPYPNYQGLFRSWNPQMFCLLYVLSQKNINSVFQKNKGENQETEIIGTKGSNRGWQLDRPRKTWPR